MIKKANVCLFMMLCAAHVALSNEKEKQRSSETSPLRAICVARGTRVEHLRIGGIYPAVLQMPPAPLQAEPPKKDASWPIFCCCCKPKK